jgi:RHS repeat-associated protein
MSSSVITFVYNLRFPGQHYLPETGLYYNCFRDYDPQSGRYIESDPIGLAGGSYSTYAYARGNPISFADPLGLWWHLGDPVPQGVVNASAGLGDAALGMFFLNGQKIRNALHISGGVNQCSADYKGGQVAGIIGGIFTGAGEVEALQFIHSAEVIENGENFASLSKLSNEELLDSLAPSADQPLLVSPDGRIFDGNTRAYILQSRGVDINALPRTTYNPF